MYEKWIKQGNYIIREGDVGQYVYVLVGKYLDVNRYRCNNVLIICIIKQEYYKISYKYMIFVVSCIRMIIFGKYK